MTPGVYAGMARDLLTLVANINYGKGVGGVRSLLLFSAGSPGKVSGTCKTDRAALILKMKGCCLQED